MQVDSNPAELEAKEPENQQNQIEAEAKRKQEEGKSTWEKMTSVFTESDEVEEDLITLAMATNVDTDIEPHCGRKKKHKEQELIKPLQYCDTCEFEHADHYRLCANCNEEHDGCCEILA